MLLNQVVNEMELRYLEDTEITDEQSLDLMLPEHKEYVSKLSYRYE